jgi:hypothetical protein
MVTFYKTYSGLTGWCFKMPNAPYSNRYRQAGVEAEQSLQIFKINMLYEKNR